jgi:hypothetical protein
MHPIAGIALIALGGVVGVATAIALWSRLRTPAALGLSAVAGVCIATGGLLVQRHVSAGDWILAVGALAALAPIHNRRLLGPPGRGR